MASAIGEDRGWGMSEAVPQPRGPQYTHVYKGMAMSAIGLPEWVDHTSTSDEYLRVQGEWFLLICRILEDFLQLSLPSALFHCRVWS